MPAHNGLAINVVEDDEKLNLIMDVNLVTTLLPFVKEYLIKNDVYPGYVIECCKCKSQLEGCDDLKAGIQTRVRPTPLTITLPGPIPYSSEKVVPWHYDFDVYYHGVKQEEKYFEEKSCMDNNLSVDNLAGTGRITRSGRVFPSPNAQDSVDSLEKAKGKQVVADNQETVQINVPQQNIMPSASSSPDVEELLRIIRKSDYKVVDQLSQTPSKISILSLLLCSKTHRNALVKLLSSSFVPQDITVNQLEEVVASIFADNGLGFTDFDLPPEGRNHNKALHIYMECKGTTLSRVLVDIGSSLDVLPKSALMKIDYAGVKLRPSDLIVRAFDGSRRAVFGEVDLPIKIGPQVFSTTFFVMDIQPAYCCLLGRPWIHRAWSVTSNLHQKMKFPMGGKVITVCGEEEYMVSHLASFRYLEDEWEFHETPFQAFEVVQVIKAPHSEEKKPATPMLSIKDARAVVEAGHPEGWDHVLDIPPKFDKFGLGFSPASQSSSPRAPNASTLVRFSSAGFVNG
ncbi:uncharacterized protein LOC127136279 [Lathyrus oleraceus]|uniref:uncharacterized protein LOC127136279 n=1 Tax=Pisum sativum TaxID=3888 RepID=UPI0021D1A239|nr:uncharacterized protein LOC127136279 [Pisum sativum]